MGNLTDKASVFFTECDLKSSVAEQKKRIVQTDKSSNAPGNFCASPSLDRELIKRSLQLDG